MDAYYDREYGPTKEEAVRWSRARTADELTALDAVLNDFFTMKDGRYVQSRVEQEFDEAAVIAQRNAENGKRGGRPRKAASNPEKTQSVSSGNPSETVEKPNPLIHESTNPVKAKDRSSASGSRLPPDWTLPAEWRDWAKTERPDVDPDHQAEIFADYWFAAAGAKGRKADWQATWRNWIRRAAAKTQNGVRNETRPRLSEADRIAEQIKQHGVGDPDGWLNS